MKIRSKAFLPGMLLVTFIAVFFFPADCGAIDLELEYKPLSNFDSLLSSVSPLKIKMQDFQDKRSGNPEPNLIGAMQRRKNGPHYDVESERPAAEIIREAIASELKRNGHQIVESDEDIVMGGKIKTFWLRTEPNNDLTAVIGNMDIVITTIDPHTGKSTILGPYSAFNREGRKKPDSSSVMERILNKTLSLLMKEMSSDAELASALGEK